MISFLKKIFKFLMSRMFIVGILLLIQIIILILLILQIGVSGLYVMVAFFAVAIIVDVSIINRDFNPAYKISWVLAVTIIPFVGVSFYLMFGRVAVNKKTRKLIYKNHSDLIAHLENKDPNIIIKDDNFNKIRNYVKNTTAMHLWDNTITKVLTPGEEKLNYLLEELKNAERFIFLEYFIIQEGKMWNSILEILEEKVKQGVDVRLIYDDFGCIKRLPSNFKKKLIAKGIKVKSFNPIVPRLSMIMNYRDHRKIAIIDGNVGITGGINLADEYINEIELFGHWKDASILIKGDAVWNLTLLFLEMWRFVTKEEVDYEGYKPTLSYPTTGFVLPFGDGPFTGHLSTEMTYMQIIQNTKKYIYITTPYLILDNEIVTALKTSAISGVDVRIITPCIPDKKIVFLVTKSYYKELIEAGVKIYEYTPGFIHSKTFVADDEIGMIGTANLDFRSLYLHFEDSVILYKTTSVNELKIDFENTLELSKQVTYEECTKMSFLKKIIASILRAFSPML